MKKNDAVENGLEQISESGVAPETRLSSARCAWNILSKLIDADSLRDKKRSIVQGQIDGNRPYSEAKLKQLGQSYRSNVNWRDAEGLIDSRKTSYYELLMEVDTLVDISIVDYDDRQAPNNVYAETIALKFSEMLKDWSYLVVQHVLASV